MKKWSVFIFKFVVDSEIILYNVKNTGIVALEKDMYYDISNALSDQSYLSIHSEEINQLEEMEFILNDDLDEFNEFLKSIKLHRENENSLSVDIMTTTDCNFSCSYCYEDTIEKSHYLTQDVVDAFLIYLRDYILTHEIKKVNIMLYGGEPTLSWNLVVDTLSKIKDICDTNEISMSSSMITNGYLFDKQKAEDLLPYNFNSFQVTLDGYKDYHDKRRHTKNQDPTFDVIIKNLQNIFRIFDKLTCHIRMNCDTDNVESIHKLAKFIYENFGNERISISFSNLFGDPCNTSKSASALSLISKKEISDQKYAEQLPDFFEIISSFGFIIPEFYGFDGFCMAKSKHSFTLHPSGDMYKCACMAGIIEHKFGNIFQQKSLGSYFDEDLYQKCIEKKCCFLPACHTGCPYHSFLKHGDPSKVYCRYKQYEAVNKRLIVLNSNTKA